MLGHDLYREAKREGYGFFEKGVAVGGGHTLGMRAALIQDRFQHELGVWAGNAIYG